jgi:hypothetical protein
MPKRLGRADRQFCYHSSPSRQEIDDVSAQSEALRRQHHSNSSFGVECTQPPGSRCLYLVGFRRRLNPCL